LTTDALMLVWGLRHTDARGAPFDRARARAGGRRGVTDSANVDLVRPIYADWERGDFSSADWADPEIEYVWPDGLAPGSSTGLVGMAEAMRGVLSAWEDFRVEAVECRELDDERFLVFTRASGRGKASGLISAR
jgi:hypothetical protein